MSFQALDMLNEATVGQYEWEWNEPEFRDLLVACMHPKGVNRRKGKRRINWEGAKPTEPEYPWAWGSFFYIVNPMMLIQLI